VKTEVIGWISADLEAGKQTDIKKEGKTCTWTVLLLYAIDCHPQKKIHKQGEMEIVRAATSHRDRQVRWS
jgi:hypothetical protein